MRLRALFVDDGGAIRAPWRIAFFLAASACAAALVGGLIYPVLAQTPLPAFARAWRLPLDEIWSLVAVLLGTWASLRIVDGARRADWSRVGLGLGGLRWRPLAVGLAAGTFGILVPSAALIAAGRLAIELQPAMHPWTTSARDALFLLAPAALVEELLFRGYLLSVLRDAVTAPGAVAVTSVLFALVHLLNPGPTILSTAMIALAGVFLAVVRLTTGSLWAAWTAHFAWNFVQAALLHAPVSGLPLPTPGYRLVDRGPEWLTGGPWGPEGGLAAAAGMLVATFLMVWRPMGGKRGTPERLRASTVEN